jgi:Cu/Ag efflux protein CusF
MRCFWQSPPRVSILRMRVLARCLLTAIVTLILAAPGHLAAQDKPSSSSAGAQVAKAVGVIKSIQADSITVAAESGGGDIIAKLTGSTKILRVPPGEKDLKNATALEAQDLQPGDRVLVRGPAVTGGDGHAEVVTITALAVIVVKQADVAVKQQHDLDDWQKRGVDGIVTKVDAATGTITISRGGIGARQSVAVHIGKNTILRRYPPGSAKYEDAKPAPVGEGMAQIGIVQIKVGDQFHARGTRNPDGSDVIAEEVVSGTFPIIEGTIKTVDAAGNTVTVQDAIRKTAVVVAVPPDSLMWKLPAEMDQRFARQLKAAAGGGSGDQPGGNGQGTTPQSAPPGTGGTRPGTEWQVRRGQGAGQGPGSGGNGPPDLQRMFQRALSHLPNCKLADLQKGDIVYILATEDGNSDTVRAIKLLAGVEAILTASPNRSSSLLSSWSLGAPNGESEAAQ